MVQENQETMTCGCPKSTSANRYDALMADLLSIEEVLLPQINELAEKIDSTFKDISEGIMDLSKEIVSSGVFNKKNDFKIMAGAAAAAVIVDSIGAGYKAYKFNKQLDAILEKKQKVASENKPVIEKIIPMAEKSLKNAISIVLPNVEKEYEIDYVVSDVTGPLLLDNMKKEINILRTSFYYWHMLKYLLLEYEAWLSGNQTSEMERPCLFTANKDIFTQVLKVTDKNILENVINGNRKHLDGKELYVIIDSQLTATCLDYNGNNHKFIKDKKNSEYEPLNIAVSSNGNAKFRNFLKKNPLLLKAEKHYCDYMKVVSKGTGTTIPHMIFFVVLVADMYLFYSLDWAIWLRWILAIITGWIIIKMWKSRIETLELRFMVNIRSVCDDAYRTIMASEGYKEYNKDAFKKKSIMGEALGGIFN